MSRVTPESNCPFRHPIRPDGTHVHPADLEWHVWHIESRLMPAGVACVNTIECIYAGAPWHFTDSSRHQRPEPA